MQTSDGPETTPLTIGEAYTAISDLKEKIEVLSEIIEIAKNAVTNAYLAIKIFEDNEIGRVEKKEEVKDDASTEPNPEYATL
jgi:hypothetical protein